MRPAQWDKGPRSRDEAYRRLGEIADYLLRTEPHSPVPYLVKRAVAWGGMPLAELLQELLDSESDLKQIYRLLGTRGR
jgi:type VI secretion system protein ImpA